MTMPVNDTLYRYWSRLAQFMGWEESASDEKYFETVSRYEEEQRHFHTRGHLHNIFNVLELEKYSERNQALLIAVTFWHDAIYDTSSRDAITSNEENSAVLFENDMREMGAPDEFIAHGATIIRNSRDHKCDAQADPVGAAFLDADMATLAGTWEQYTIGSEQINEEYRSIPCESFYRSRLAGFIDPLLSQDSIYLLAENEAKWGASARANLSREKEEILLALSEYPEVKKSFPQPQ